MVTPPLARSLFDLPRDLVWALHCAEGPVPLAAVQAARAFLAKEARPWDLGQDEWLAIPAAARRAGADLLDARAEDVTLTGSTSAGLAVVAQSFPWQDGDEVLAPLGEFPSNVWPWRALAGRGVSFREVPLWDGQLAGAAWERATAPTFAADPEARLLAALGPRTRLLTVSWVRFQDGLRLDLGRLARGCAERGVALVVDGIQGAGTLPVPLAGVAAFATGVHKGLLAPQGLGILWTAPAFRAALRPLGSWLSVEGGDDLARPFTDLERRWLDDGRRFEQGGANGLGLVALTESLRLLAAVGVPTIAAHVARLVATLLAALAVHPVWAGEAARLAALTGVDRLGALVSLHHGGRGEAFLRELAAVGRRRGIYTSVREGFLRVALHGYHDEEDLAALVAWLAEVR